MRKLTILVASFAAVLLAGVAFAQVGVLSPSDQAQDDTSVVYDRSGDLSELEPREGKDLPGQEEAPSPEPEMEDEAENPGPGDAQEAAGGELAKEESTDDEGVWLEILYPENGQVVHEKTIAFEGRVSPDTKVYRGKYEADINQEDASSTWRIVLVLSSGENLVPFEAVSADGESTTASVRVIYEPFEAEEPKEEPKDEAGKYDWTAYQKYGECAEDPPYDVFYGTGAPGTDVWIESAHGSGMTTVGDYGKWDLKVVFAETPCGEEFKVVIETSEGDRSEFWFVRICEDGGGDK